VPPEDLIARGHACLRVGDAAGARASFERALEEDGPTAPVLEGLASSSFVLMEFARAITEMERAYAAHRAQEDGAGAARVARMLGGMVGTTTGDWAVASGWIARAKSLSSTDPDPLERGWVALTEGMFAPVRAVKHEAFRSALEVGLRTGDPGLTFATLAYLGASLVHGDQVEEGMTMLDESLAAVAGGEVDDFIVIEEIFCQLVSACEHVRDVERAEQWIRVGEQIALERRLPAVSAYCRTHYGGVLTAAGRWSEADETLSEAVRLWTLGRRNLKAGALVRLAELRVRQGRYDEAERLLDGLTGGDAAGPRAALHLARAENALALDVVEHEVRHVDPGSSSCIPLLGLLVEAQLACGEDPTTALEDLGACVEMRPSAYARAVHALSLGRAGREDPRRCFRDAVDAFTRAQLPWEAAVARLELAQHLAATSPEVAISHARAALRDFEQLHADRGADAAGALLRRLGEKVASPRGPGQGLTRREHDVLDLMGEGLSNPEIAQRLFISRKTVEHHVGNVLAKLGLRNRAEAAAFTVREGSATK
jgi:DNA-binding NarL/FixJ family response regulator